MARVKMTWMAKLALLLVQAYMVTLLALILVRFLRIFE